MFANALVPLTLTLKLKHTLRDTQYLNIVMLKTIYKCLVIICICVCVCVSATMYLVDTRMYDRYYQGKSNYIHTQANMIRTVYSFG